LYEPIIAGLPGVTDAAMVGIADEIGDDRIVVAVTPATPGLADRVARALPGLIDAGALPDEVVALDELPRKGRSRKLDRARLAALLEARA
ncbi:MAG: AMP-binding enzyme, partial [Pseudolysinimonas sp.]